MPDTTKAAEKTAAEAAKIAREERRAHFAQVLVRGVLNTRLQLILDESVPEGRFGKFVRDDKADVIRAENLGFTFEYKEGAVGVHGDSTGRIRAGDCVLMTISEEDAEIHRELRRELVKRKFGEARREYMSRAEEAAEEGGAAPFDSSQTIIDKR